MLKILPIDIKKGRKLNSGLCDYFFFDFFFAGFFFSATFFFVFFAFSFLASLAFFSAFSALSLSLAFFSRFFRSSASFLSFLRSLSLNFFGLSDVSKTTRLSDFSLSVSIGVVSEFTGLPTDFFETGFVPAFWATVFLVPAGLPGVLFATVFGAASSATSEDLTSSAFWLTAFEAVFLITGLRTAGVFAWAFDGALSAVLTVFAAGVFADALLTIGFFATAAGSDS
ncbi:hypothetical protein [Flavobacterium selenitireducens]|uniref:hypothetical protein n=1 Tax=Flavobacterium selenitireducens TaxID=2722704 RepID=UPI00168A516A|nr:hypothetical protein [Flavobacterium selenitireducens]MBD3582059.1 hypothetical protein [Flavobacterium selenitireducens]